MIVIDSLCWAQPNTGEDKKNGGVRGRIDLILCEIAHWEIKKVIEILRRKIPLPPKPIFYNGNFRGCLSNPYSHIKMSELGKERIPSLTTLTLVISKCELSLT